MLFLRKYKFIFIQKANAEFGVHKRNTKNKKIKKNLNISNNIKNVWMNVRNITMLNF